MATTTRSRAVGARRVVAVRVTAALSTGYGIASENRHLASQFAELAVN
jgi:hypothetical protein